MPQASPLTDDIIAKPKRLPALASFFLLHLFHSKRDQEAQLLSPSRVSRGEPPKILVP
jgi:hypothetical protein